MITALVGITAASASAAIAAEWSGQESRHRSYYLLKPLTTVLVIALALSTASHTAESYRLWIVVGLLFCLAGDICLLYSGERWFLGGLSNFLVGHLLFIAAFLDGVGMPTLPWWSVFWAAALPVVVFIVPRTGALKIPVMIYMTVIGLMALAALARYHALGDVHALLALIGASVFMLSDSALAVRQFFGPYRLAQPLILSSYWLAIVLIAWSI